MRSNFLGASHILAGGFRQIPGPRDPRRIIWEMPAVLRNKMIKIMIVIGLSCIAWHSVMAQENERIKREQAQIEVQKRAKKAERMVRDNEKGWSLERSDKDLRSVSNYWKNKDEFANAYDIFGESIEEAKDQYRSWMMTRSVLPDKSEAIPNLGDAAGLLTYPARSIVIFRKGRHFVSVPASSEAVAKRFAKYYEQSIADEK